MVRALTGLYREALGELSDDAWLGACKAAVRSCRHFPVPAELLELADDYADAASRERVVAAERRRIDAAIDHGQRLLTAGVVTEDVAAERRERLAAMATETLAAIREGGAKAATRDADFWRVERKRRRGRRRAT